MLYFFTTASLGGVIKYVPGKKSRGKKLGGGFGGPGELEMGPSMRPLQIEAHLTPLKVILTLAIRRFGLAFYTRPLGDLGKPRKYNCHMDIYYAKTYAICVKVPNNQPAFTSRIISEKAIRRIAWLKRPETSCIIKNPARPKPQK